MKEKMSIGLKNGIFAMIAMAMLVAGMISPAVGATNSLRVLSYNILHGAGMDHRLDLKRTAAVIERLSPDLVVLQEVDKNTKRSGRVDEAAELGKMLGMQSRFGKFMDFSGGEYGLAVLSKLPIEKAVRHQLPRGSEPRCALEVQVKPAGFSQPLTLVCIHNDWISTDVRLQQVNTLLKALGNRSGPMILAGDFNAEPDDKSLVLLRQKGWKHLQKSGQQASWPADKPREKIDHLFVKNLPDFTYTCRVIDERMASDHRPVLAELWFDSSRASGKL